MRKATEGSYFKKIKIRNRHYGYQCGNEEETVEHILRQCTFDEQQRQQLKKVSANCDLKTVLDTKKCFQAVAEFLKQLPQLIN